MRYKILQSEEKTTSTGKTFKKIRMMDEQRVEHDVSAWSDYSQYAQIAQDVVVEGIITENGQYKNLKDGNLGPKSTGFGGGAKMVAEKAKNIEKAMDRKEEGIAKFQDDKERSIMISGTARDATLILTTLLGKETADIETWKEHWLKIRYWLVENYGNLSQPKVGNTDVDYPQEDIDVNSIPF